MVPKKLTDCPENLRESIDWLIQVRHGSGTDKNGLDGLAKSLKTLIAEAITKSTKSLEAEHDKLVCPFQYSATETNCQHYQTLLENRKKEIKDAEPLRDVSKDAEVKRLMGTIADCRNKYHNEHYRDPAKQKILRDIEDRQKTLGNLQTKLEAFVGKVANKEQKDIPAKHILENLTDGLEKLLGFDPKSKGYDGTGIVYSDLDRLCDGVMAFLYGLLRDVYQNQSYDVGRRVLKQLVENKIHPKLCLGHSGFKEIIDEVARQVKLYNREVEHSNKKVSDPIRGLQKEMTTLTEQVKIILKNSVSQDFVNTAVTEVNKQLDACNKNTDTFNRNMDSVERIHKAITYLNESIREKVNKARTNIRHEKKRLEKMTKIERSNLSSMTNNITTTLEDVKTQISNNISEIVKQLVEDLKKKVQEIQSELVEVYKSLGKYIKTLEDWMEKALEVIEEANRQVAVIENEVGDPEDKKNNNKSAIAKAAKEVEKQAGELHGKFETAKRQFDVVVAKIKGKAGDGQEEGCVIEKLQGLEEKVTTTMPEDFENFNTGNGGNWDFSQSIRELRQETNRQLGIAIDGIWKDLKQGLDAATESAPRSGNWKGLQALQETDLWTAKGVGKWLDSAALDYDDSGPGAKVEKVLNHLHNAQQEWENILQSNITTNIPKVIKETLSNETIDGVKRQLLGLIIAVVAGSISEMQEAVNRIVDTDLNTISQLQDSIAQQAQAAKAALETQGNLVYHHLTELCEAIKNGVKYSKQHLGTLANDTINTQLKKIRDRFTELQKRFADGALKLSEEFAGEADTLCTSTVQQLQKQVDEQISFAIAKLTSQAQKNYVSSMKGLLDAFATKVQGELLNLPERIDIDLKTEFKGFMKEMETHVSSANLKNDLPQHAKLATFASGVGNFFNGIFHSLKTKRDIIPIHKLTEIDATLNTLLNGLSNYNKKFVDDLAAVNTLLQSIRPESYNDERNKLLEILKNGLQGFHNELKNAYVSAYDSVPNVDWSDIKSTETSLQGTKCATVFLTTIDIMLKSLFKYKREVEKTKSTWKDYKMYSSNYNYSLSSLFFSKNGYDPGLPSNAEYGELNHKKGFNGNSIVDLFKSNTQVTSQPSYDILASLDDFADIIKYYLRISHLGTFSSAKHPLNAFQMLAWLSGLQHNPVKEKLTKYLQKQFDSETDVILRNILSDIFTSELPSIYTPAYDMLTSIVGYGDADTLYACQYLGNSLELHYPSDAAACFDMLLDVLRKLCPVLQFLYWQCKLGVKNLGWRDCHYGKNAGTSSWQCKEHSDQTPDCQRTSPLMSYLTDCLLGHLPHQLQSVGCTSKCSTCSSSSPKMPCLTPLGFRTFSCSTRTGKDLCSVLDKLCGDRGVLTKLYASLACFVGRPPQTFPDVFAFYYQLVQPWTPMTEYKKPSNSIEQALSNTIEKTVSCKYEDAKQFINQCRSLYESPSHFLHDITRISDMSYLVGCGEQDCGYIIRPINSAAYGAFAPKHAKSYLSWLVHVCPQLVDFFKQLQKAFSDVSCADSRCSPCLHSESCTKGKHGTTSCGCSSIVHCQPVSSILYKYGLTYADAANKSQIKCQDFSNVLKNILNSQVLGNFLHAIDTLMFTIRTPFIWTVVALWSLSLLYLFYVLIGRLDTLHIKSHLRSPASYKIAAQSLLAAARVGKLAKISYLQA
ncbi:hypothetical protein BBBOND_0309670 [Babesia bigemina]|uniref:Uncharacterized protein n=1 Tax=Babesia bigemina TaxID=5866 RepID=A0A061DD34_BABBI|nr:hypothetical protein BBBOND_0309670 [Babesia bigemina]CDR97064.1 hypothetical protein BBBOND_0309670 [Babesia bigemina]|eukprot:XP_012769250.1 hypothetical protein BBBOND_0309670 [Babesia bigemina]